MRKKKKTLQNWHKFVDKSSGGTRFPMWLAQSVIPLSFDHVASLEALGLSGRFEDDDEEEDDEEEKEIDAENISAPPPPKV